MFQYTGVSVIAALNGTTLYIDKNSDGTPDVTTTLSQGQAYLWIDLPQARPTTSSGMGSTETRTFIRTPTTRSRLTC